MLFIILCPFRFISIFVFSGIISVVSLLISSNKYNSSFVPSVFASAIADSILLYDFLCVLFTTVLFSIEINGISIFFASNLYSSQYLINPSCSTIFGSSIDVSFIVNGTCLITSVLSSL